MASTYTPNLSLEIPAHGDYASTGWDNPMDNSLRSLDTAYGGFLNLACSGGTTTLTVAQASNPIIEVTGTLSSDQYLYFPPIAGRRTIIQAINLNSHTLYVRGNNGSDGTGVYFDVSFGIPYPIIVTPSRVYWDYGPAGPGTIAEMPVGWIHNGWLPCDGRYVSSVLHDLLYDIIGGTWGISGSSFKLPDYRGTVTAMADQIGTIPASGPYAQNTGNRGILNSWGITTFAGEANHVLSATEMPSHNHTDSGHGHPGSQDAHNHTVGGTLPSVGEGAAQGYGGVLGTGTTSTAQPNVYIGTGNANISYAGGSGGHNNVQPTTCTMKVIRW